MTVTHPPSGQIEPPGYSSEINSSTATLTVEFKVLTNAGEFTLNENLEIE